MMPIVYMEGGESGVDALAYKFGEVEKVTVSRVVRYRGFDVFKSAR